MRFGQKSVPRIVLAGLVSLLFVLSVFLSTGIKAFAESNGVSDLSLYQRASELTREFATALAPGSKVDHLWMIETTNGNDPTDPKQILAAGNAGALLGYAEILSDDEGVVGWLMNSYTTASATITYDQLMHVVDTGGDSVYDAGLKNPFFQYAGYGEVLTEMGLISTIRPGMGPMGRTVGTGLVLLVYLLANVAPFLFRGALAILTTLNPFKFFETVFNGAAHADLGVISGVADYVSSIYKAVQDLSILILMPFLLVITTLGVLMFRKSALKQFSRYGVRIFMLFAGLPLIGATYTGIIEDLDAKVSVGSEYADYLILSSYVDFEGWVKYSRLAPPADSNIRNPRYSDDEDRSLSDRSLILDINGSRAANPRAEALKDRYSSTSDIGEIFKKGGTQKDVTSNGTMSAADKSSFSKVFSLLTRHMTSARYTSSDYDGEVAGQIQKMRVNNRSDDNEEAIVKMFSLTASDNRTWSEKINPFDKSANKDWMKPIFWNGKDNDVNTSAKGLFTAGNALNDTYQFKGYPFNIYNAGNLQYDASHGYYSPDMPDIVTKKTAPIGSNRAGTVGGLSPIAMYNFLNTTFSNTGLTVFSPSKTATDLSRDSYAAVTFGGSGVASVTRWIEDVVVMLSLAVLAIAFGVMMISASVKNIPRILSGVFGTAFGSIAFTTKLLISTAVMLIQVLGMIFLYSLSENIIMTLLLNFNSLMSVGGEYFGRGVIFEFLGSFLVTVVTATVTIFMIKNMKVFREMMEEVVSNAINRVMGALDTGTGGKGLDIAKTTDGRIGNNGKLTDAAKQADAGGLMGGAAGLLGAAHGLESKYENLMAEQGGTDANGNPIGRRTLGEKIKARLGTAADLAKAKGADVAKGTVGVNGQSVDRMMEAKNDAIKSMKYGDSGLSQNMRDKFTKTDDIAGAAGATNSGQVIDEDGNLITDAQGNALDKDGRAISMATPLGKVGMGAMVADDGSLMDADGNIYTDEMGNAFYQNENGQLVDSSGQFVGLDKDGVLQPVTDIPGHNGKPMDAVKEAKRLDAMRFDADKYASMQKEQAASHYGLNEKGQAVGSNGQSLQVNGADAQLDDKGFITDKQGNRVAASNVSGVIDPRGFEEVVDPTTGATNLRHKGDEAMKYITSDNSPAENKATPNLTTLARQSNRAKAIADKAAQRVEQLKTNGSSPYAVMQAQRFADTAAKNAKVAQTSFNQAMKESTNSTTSQPTTAQVQPVTNEHVTSASRYAKSQQAALKNEVSKLEQMQTSGSSEQMIARQARKVETQRAAAQEAATMERSTRIAKQAGRSFNEVQNASERVARTADVFSHAQQAHTQAVESGQPKKVIAKYEKRMNKASKALSDARNNFSRVSKPPMGSRVQIDQATALYEQAQATHRQATQRVQALQYGGGSDQEMKIAKRQQAQAERKVVQARKAQQKLLNPVGWTNDRIAHVQSVPSISPTKSYAELASSGITTYADYSEQVIQQSSDLKTNQSKLQQAKSRLATLRSSNRPPQIIEQAEAQVSELTANVQAAHTKLKSLQDNAQGLLKKGGFQPVIASRPIRKNGSAIMNQLIQLSHTQSIYDTLAYQAKSGMITEAGRTQMKQLGGQLNYMRKDLVSAGIREDAIRDSASITTSTKHMQQSWDAFINGKSIEHGE